MSWVQYLQAYKKSRKRERNPSMGRFLPRAQQEVLVRPPHLHAARGPVGPESSGGGESELQVGSGGEVRPVFIRAVCAALPRDDSSDRSRQFDETGAVRRVNGRSRRSILLLSLRAVVYRTYF